MPTLNINGTRVRVDDSFISMSPEQQDATVDEIAASLRSAGQDGPSTPRPAAADGALAASNEGIMQGATFGYGDEIMAGMMTPIEMGMQAFRGDPMSVSGAYDSALQKNRGELHRQREQNPAAAMAGEVAGGLATGGGLAKGGLTLAKPGAGLVGQTGRAAAEGAALGAVYGFGSGEGGFGERLAGAREGAKYGAVGGAAVPLGVAGVAGAGRMTARAASPATAAIGNRFRPEQRAAKLLEESFRRDGISIDEAGQRLDAMSRHAPDAVLADVGGSNVRGRARAAVNTPGAGREAIMESLEARSLAQPDRISNALANTLGDEQRFGQTVARMTAERERIASPIYKKAFSTGRPVNVSGVVRHIDEQIKPGVSGLADPAADLRPDGISATLGNLRKFFATAKNQRFDLKALHNIKMELDGMIGVAKRSGDKTKARALQGVQNRLLKAMDAASPEYRKARGIYSSSHDMEDALETGSNIFRMNAEEVRSEIARMTPGQREMVQIGAARAIQDRINSQRDGRDIIKAVFGSPQIRSTLRAMFQNDQAFRKFQATLVREARMRRTTDAVRGNSTTAQQLADRADLEGGAVGRDTVELLLEGRPVQAAAAAVRQAVKGEQGISEEVANRLSDMLLSKDKARVQKAMRILKAREGAVSRLRARLEGASQLAAPGAATGVAVSR